MLKPLPFMMVAVMLAFAFTADAGQGTGRIAGTARDGQNQVLANVTVQLRNIDSGQLVATTRSAGDGRFEFTGLNPGNYLVEIVSDDGKVIGLSPSTALAAGGVVAGLTVAASATGAAVGATSFFASTGGVLVLASAGIALTAGIIAITQDASPSK